MPIFVTMAFSHESEQPGRADGGETSETAILSIPGADAGPDGITPDACSRSSGGSKPASTTPPEVREQIARRVRKELDD